MIELQDFGTLALLLFAATTTLIRARYFCKYGKDALLVCILYMFTSAIVRTVSIHANLGIDTARFLGGLVNLSFFFIQVINFFMGEMTLRTRKKLGIQI